MLGQCEGVGGGLGPDAAAASVHLDHYPDRAVGGCCGLRQAIDSGAGVAGDGDGAELLFYETGQALELGFADDIIGDQDIFDTALGHGLGLAELLADDADGAGGDLSAGDGGRFVGLGVDAQRDVEAVAGALQVGDVLIQDIEIDAEGGGVEFAKVHDFRSFR